MHVCVAHHGPHLVEALVTGAPPSSQETRQQVRHLALNQLPDRGPNAQAESVSQSIGQSVSQSIGLSLSVSQTVRQSPDQSAQHLNQQPVRQLVGPDTKKTIGTPVSPAVVGSLHKAQLTGCSLRQVWGSTTAGVLLRRCPGNGHVRSHGGVVVQHVKDVAVADGLRWNGAVGVWKSACI